jgi:hypothetical protein
MLLLLGAGYALAQHGHGGGVGAGVAAHGAPPSFTPATKTATAAHGSTSSAGEASRASTGGALHSSPATVTSNAQLSSRVQALLPAGTTVQSAAMGFRNTGQFLAAVHVSNNLNIPFAQLKARMTGTSPESLGRAIQDLRPNLTKSQVKMAVRTADRQASRDVTSTNLTQAISVNPRLARRVQSLLPAGMTLQTASVGFRNQGQFLAALHVSRNLGIPFAQLQAKMTGSNPESLGKAIADLRPALSRDMVKADVEVAEAQANRDLKG